MIRVAAFLIAILAIGSGLAWLADRPGTISLVWQGYQVETSAMAGMLALLAFTALAILAWRVYRIVIGAPGSVTDWFRGRRRIKGYQALSQGMVAVGAGDQTFALQQAKQARKLLTNEPLVGLLTAQAAQLSGDSDAAKAAFKDMLDDPQTVLLGLHGIFVEAERAGDHPTARRAAEEAVERSPSLAWAAFASLDYCTREQDWEGALAALERNERYRVIDKPTAKRQRAVLKTAIAAQLEDAVPEKALTLAQEAHKLAPDLVPAAVIAGRLAAQAGKMSVASNVLEKTWKQAPHPDIADVYAHIRAGDTTTDRLKRVRALAKKNMSHFEAKTALAAAAIDATEWQEARRALGSLVHERPSRAVCVMMAQIEDGENGDRGKVREWLARAVNAPRDPAWVADGHISDSWAPVSPVSGQLDAFEWVVPSDETMQDQSPVLEALGAATPGLGTADGMIPDADAPLIEAQATETEAKPDAGPAPVTVDAIEPDPDWTPAGPSDTAAVSAASQADSSLETVVERQPEVAADPQTPAEVEAAADTKTGGVSAAATVAAAGHVLEHEADKDVSKGDAEPQPKALVAATSAKDRSPEVADAEAGESQTETDTPLEAVEPAKADPLDTAKSNGAALKDEATSESVAKTDAKAAAIQADEADTSKDDEPDHPFLTRLPDDPGVSPEGDTPPKKKWLGLFN